MYLDIVSRHRPETSVIKMTLHNTRSGILEIWKRNSDVAHALKSNVLLFLHGLTTNYIVF